jgi:23S rRNA pseudouridine2605 synthase
VAGGKVWRGEARSTSGNALAGSGRPSSTRVDAGAGAGAGGCYIDKIGRRAPAAARRYNPSVKRRSGNQKKKNDTLRKVGLARALSKSGYCSRSQAAELIRAGRVTLNGALRRDPETPVHIGKDRMEVDGKPLANSKKTYLILNKPRGAVTTASDEKERETVYSYLPENLSWLAPVGRLDKASEGLLLLTNDSEWAARVTAPETHLDKTYHVQIDVVADDALLESLQKGVTTADGDFLRVKRAGILRLGERNSWLEIVLDDGKNRHIRRMLEHENIEVLRLIRVAIGPLSLGDLPKGATRALDQEEKQALDRAMLMRNAGPVSSA